MRPNLLAHSNDSVDYNPQVRAILCDLSEKPPSPAAPSGTSGLCWTYSGTMRRSSLPSVWVATSAAQVLTAASSVMSQ